MKKNPPGISEIPFARRGLRRVAAGAMLCAAAMSAIAPVQVFAREGGREAQAGAALSFVNADIESVIKAIGHYTGMTFIVDPRVKGTLTLTSERPLSKAQAFALSWAQAGAAGATSVAAQHSMAPAAMRRSEGVVRVIFFII